MAITINHNCRCEACLAVDPNGHPHVFADPDAHVVMTGPIKGSVTLPDGSSVDVSPLAVEADSPEHAAEIAHAIGRHWEARGHPDDIEVDEESGKPVVRPFVYDDAHHKKHGRKPGRGGKKG